MRNAIATYATYPELAKAMLPYSEFLFIHSTLPAMTGNCCGCARHGWRAQTTCGPSAPLPHVARDLRTQRFSASLWDPTLQLEAVRSHPVAHCG